MSKFTVFGGNEVVERELVATNPETGETEIYRRGPKGFMEPGEFWYDSEGWGPFSTSTIESFGYTSWHSRPRIYAE